MNVYTCNKFTGHYPVGVAAVVIAPDRYEATAKLNETLKAHGLPGDAEYADVHSLDDDRGAVCRILNDGDY